ncbi:hypothetical protein MRX96_058722 [Rhipicephalus microplus]
MRLKEHLLTDKPIFLNPDVASLAMIAGIVRVASECIACAECIALLQAPNSSAPNHGLIKHLERGGLYYPTQELVEVLGGKNDMNTTERFLQRSPLSRKILKL